MRRRCNRPPQSGSFTAWRHCPTFRKARSDTAQAQYDLQAVLGVEQIAWGDLATALGTPAPKRIRVQPLSEVLTPETISDTVEAAIERALHQRPDLQAQAAEIRVAQAERQLTRDLAFDREAW